MGKGVWGRPHSSGVTAVEWWAVWVAATGLQCGGQYMEELRSTFTPSTGPPKLIHSAVSKTSRPMVAAFDYNPRENSPNMDVEVRTLLQ